MNLTVCGKTEHDRVEEGSSKHVHKQSSLHLVDLMKYQDHKNKCCNE